METWTIQEAQRRLDAIIHQAGSCGPQRVAGPDGDVFILSATDYTRLVTEGSDFLDEASEPSGEPMNFLEFMQRSPLAEAMRAGDIDVERYPDWPRGL
jgi:hypothetical protein